MGSRAPTCSSVPGPCRPDVPLWAPGPHYSLLACYICSLSFSDGFTVFFVVLFHHFTVSCFVYGFVVYLVVLFDGFTIYLLVLFDGFTVYLVVSFDGFTLCLVVSFYHHVVRGYKSFIVNHSFKTFTSFIFWMLAELYSIQ